MQIDFIFDAVCPWCYIGKRRLEAALRLRPHLSVTPRWRPFLLNPEIPPEGIDRTAYLVNKFGSEARVSRVYGAIAKAGQSAEIDFEFDRIRQTPNTVNAHRMVRFAERSGRANEAVEALFLNYFVNGKNIGENDILIDIGKNLGLDDEALEAYLRGDRDAAFIYEENARAHRLGINGVPSFIFNTKMAISGAQDAEILARILDAAQEVGDAA